MSKSNNINKKIDNIFKEIGEFGVYQFILILLIGSVSFIQSFLNYGFSFYAATPEFRCQIPELANDTYESMGSWHNELIDKYIPIDADKHYIKCSIKVYNNDTTDTNSTEKNCNSYVYSQKYFESTLTSHVNICII